MTLKRKEVFCDIRTSFPLKGRTEPISAKRDLFPQRLIPPVTSAQLQAGESTDSHTVITARLVWA